MFSRQLARSAPRHARLLSTTPSLRADTVAGSIKETAHSMDKAAGRTLASGIDAAQSATDSVKDALGVAQEKAPEMAQKGKEKLGEAQVEGEKAKQEVKNAH